MAAIPVSGRPCVTLASTHAKGDLKFAQSGFPGLALQPSAALRELED